MRPDRALSLVAALLLACGGDSPDGTSDADTGAADVSDAADAAADAADSSADADSGDDTAGDAGGYVFEPFEGTDVAPDPVATFLCP
ncbi:MAG: hypothetical protein KDA28_09415, partial [Phycisphaerales bacterium]|nr:hypothetical protein [Phycisphaerales bacterium]